MRAIRFIDLFCGIGGFRLAFEQAASELGIGSRCVFSCDIDPYSREVYKTNFGQEPFGDIRLLDAAEMPDHDVLLAGFPCQSFSIIGRGRGFKDETNGTLFFDLLRVLEIKRPTALVLENVRRLVTHDQGRTMQVIAKSLQKIGYAVDYRVLNALDFGLPQKRERVFIIGYQGNLAHEWPVGEPMKRLDKILEPDERVPKKFWASDYIREKRRASHASEIRPSIWHENKSGKITSHPYSCALRARASYNYLLVNGERRLMPREMLRLQGFPDEFKIACTDERTRSQAGNSLAVPVAAGVIKSLIAAIKFPESRRR